MLILLAGCSGPPEGDAARYYRVLSSPELEPSRAMAICESIGDTSVRGDCGLVVASRSAPPGQWCPRVEAGTWRQECYFQAAESLRRSGRAREAVALCLESGPFRDDCGQHLWQTQLHMLLGERGVEALADTLPRAWELYGAWEPLLGDYTDFRHRFWRRFYEDAFESTPPPTELAPCDALEREDDRQRCVKYGVGVFQQRLRHELGPGLCQGAALPPVEDPRLAAAAERAREEACRRAPPLKEERSLRKQRNMGPR